MNYTEVGKLSGEKYCSGINYFVFTVFENKCIEQNTTFAEYV